MTDPAARLAEIRERRKPGTALTLAILIQDAKTTHPFTGDEPVVVHGCVVSNAAALKAEVGQVWFHDLPDLLDALEAVLALAADFDAAAARNYSRANLSTSGMAASGSADAYATAARRIREALAAALNKQAARAAETPNNISKEN